MAIDPPPKTYPTHQATGLSDDYKQFIDSFKQALEKVDKFTLNIKSKETEHVSTHKVMHFSLPANTNVARQ
jgi:hypothetical protein